MRISDWSSDVCSSDLDGETRAFDVRPIDQRTLVSPVLDGRSDAGHRRGLCPDLVSPSVAGTGADAADHPAGLASRSVVHRLVAIVRDPGGAGVGRQAAAAPLAGTAGTGLHGRASARRAVDRKSTRL